MERDLLELDFMGEDLLEEREDDFRSGCSPSCVWHGVSDFLCRSPISDL